MSNDRCDTVLPFPFLFFVCLFVLNLEKEAEDIDRDRRTVFACQIHPRVDERDIFEFFSQCGKVRDVQLIRDAKTSKSKGCVKLTFLSMYFNVL